MRTILAAVLLFVALPAYSQVLPACAPPPADPVPRDQARINWTRPTTNTDGTAIPATTVLTYTLYRRVGTTDTAICTSMTAPVGVLGLSVGTHTWVATARVGTGPESTKSSSTATKTVPEPTPTPPTNITVASTRIEPDSWTCRDASGVILSRHERQDKAQESCTNFALANLGTDFEMRPSGYRIVAR